MEEKFFRKITICEPRNRGETLFEHWCHRNDIRYTRIPRQHGRRTPDYELVISGTTIIAEVKGIERNKEEQKNLEKSRKAKYGLGQRRTLGGRVRKKINDCQISEWVKTERYLGPTILVLHETDLYKHLGPWNILAGMYGTPTVEVSASREGGFAFGPVISGGDKRMTADANTSIGAIMELTQIKAQNRIDVNIYHNCYARYPLNPRTLDFPDTKHWHKHPMLAQWGGWEESLHSRRPPHFR